MSDKPAQKVSRVAITIAAIVSVIFCLLLYVGCRALFAYMDESNLSAGTRTLLSIVAFGVVLMGPTLAVLFIVVPVLNRAKIPQK